MLAPGLWRDNHRRHQRLPTLELLRTFGNDYKLIIVGDAAMSPYEISHPGGSVEHFNDEAGGVWQGFFLRRALINSSI